MKKITERSIQSLMKYNKGAALTLYIPTHRHAAPMHMQEDQTRYKNLVSQGLDLLSEVADDATVSSIQKQLEAKLNDADFWHDMTETLAVFASKKKVQMFQLPVEVDERVHVGPSYDLAPLLVLRDMNQPFYVLALAMHQPKLFQGDMYDLKRVRIDLPESVEKALNIDEMFANSNTVRGHEGSGGLSQAIGPHGQGDSSEAGREERMKFFRIIDQKIRSYKKFDQNAPFIIAATDTEAGDFMAHSEIKNIVDDFIHGNHLKDSVPELHQKAYDILRGSVLGKQTEDLIERYNELIGSRRSSSNQDDIEEAARSGRIDTLMVRMFDMTNDSVSDAKDESLRIRYDDDYDKTGLLELIKSVVAHGGRIIGLDASTMPEGSPVAALYRY